MEGFEMSLLNYRLAETFRNFTKPFFVFIEGRTPRIMLQKNFQISFKGNVNKNCFGPIEMRKSNFIIWTTESQELLDVVKRQLGLTLDANIRRFLGKKLGKKRPQLKIHGFVNRRILRIACSIGKKSFATTQMQF